ncbi:MAG: hypothetical protein EHM34_04765 [Nitrosopumilales archaeon]|nr:MAG: hypothetical protein EHM34_04765 [Nitrosopumilales archaeon]
MKKEKNYYMLPESTVKRVKCVKLGKFVFCFMHLDKDGTKNWRSFDYKIPSDSKEEEYGS